MLAHEHTDVRSTVSHNTCFYQDFTPSDIPHQLAVSPQQVIRLLLLLILAVSRRGRFPLLPPRNVGFAHAERWHRARRSKRWPIVPIAWSSGSRNASRISELDITKGGLLGHRGQAPENRVWIPLDLLLQLLSLRPQQPMLCHSSLVLSRRVHETPKRPEFLGDFHGSRTSVCIPALTKCAQSQSICSSQS